MARKTEAGFTLIEVMIVVTIIGLLSALAVPAYQNYTVRAQVTEGMNLAAAWKPAIAEYYANYGTWPSQSDLAGMVPSTGQYVSTVTVNAGVIQIIYGGQANQAINGAMLTLVPYPSPNDDVLWQCGLAPAPDGSTSPPSQTTLSPQQLPAPCRN